MPTTAQVQQDRAERMSILVERGLTDGQIHTAFSRYDVGKNGTLEVDEVAAALSTLSLRRDTDTAALFDRLDRNHDGRVQYNEFAAFVKEKEGELRELYCHLDVDGNGVLSRDEILAALDTLGLKADAQRLDAMITAMDSDSDGAISFSDFRTMLLLFPSTTHHRVFDAWTAAASVSIADAVFEVRIASYPRLDCASLFITRYMCTTSCGGNNPYVVCRVTSGWHSTCRSSSHLGVLSGNGEGADGVVARCTSGAHHPLVWGCRWGCLPHVHCPI
eukprot:m.198858 g.198858  ORF g.198858 m.198858 type:complete len:275 (-) comp25153_c0_seq3:945-1769(-)